MEYEEKLYLAEPERLLRRLQAVDEDEPSVMLVGHNPGFHALAAALVGDGDPSDLQRLRQKYPTGAWPRSRRRSSAGATWKRERTGWRASSCRGSSP